MLNRRLRTPQKRKPEAQIVLPRTPKAKKRKRNNRALRSKTLLTDAEKACWHCIFRVVENYDPEKGTAPAFSCEFASATSSACVGCNKARDTCELVC